MKTLNKKDYVSIAVFFIVQVVIYFCLNGDVVKTLIFSTISTGVWTLMIVLGFLKFKE